MVIFVYYTGTHTFEIPIQDYPVDRLVDSSTNVIYNESGMHADHQHYVNIRLVGALDVRWECYDLRYRYPTLLYILQMSLTLGLPGIRYLVFKKKSNNS